MSTGEQYTVEYRVGYTFEDGTEYVRQILEDFDKTEGLEAEVKTIHACVGHALFYAEMLEMDLHTIQLCVYKASTEKPTWTGHIALKEELQSKTLGGLLTRLQTVLGIDQDTIDILSKGRDARNQVCHGLHYRHVDSMGTRAGRRSIVESVAQLTATIRDAVNASSAISHAAVRLAGVKQSDLDASIKEYFETHWED